MNRSRFWKFSLLACCLAVCSCSDNSTSPSNVSLTGSWNGNTNAPGSAAGTGIVRATISQSGSTLSGTWGVTYINPIYNNSGQLSGTFDGTAISLTLDSSVPIACPYKVTATLQSSSIMSGTFATFNCTVAQSGSVQLFRGP